jgi:[acyl-carrier-protein] S-malonyltransferase
MLAPWAALEGPCRQLTHWSQLTGLDLISLGTVATAATIRDTAVTQPLLTAAALLSFESVDQPIDLVAGHSVGEFAALAIAGVITADQAMVTVAERGRAMAQCAEDFPSQMAAVIGPDREAMTAAITAAGAIAANFNGANQIVAGGSPEAIAHLAANPPVRARVVPLDVAGAFHTPFMAEAEVALRAAFSEITPADSQVPFVSGLTGEALTSGPQILEAVIGLVARPVRWDLVLETMAGRGIDHHLELQPAGVLTALAKRALPGVHLEQAETGTPLESTKRKEHGA